MEFLGSHGKYYINNLPLIKTRPEKAIHYQVPQTMWLENRVDQDFFG